MPDVNQPPVWISEAEVVQLMDLSGAVTALEAGFAAEGGGSAVAMHKTMASFGAHATLHAIGAAFESAGIVGTKTWAHTPGGAAPHLLLFDAGDGSLAAVIEAFALGQMRTAGTAALATDRLARSDASRLGMVGTGKQALAQVAAVACVRPVEHVTCFGRDREKAARFAQGVREELGLECSVAASAAEAVATADVVTFATRATQPVVSTKDVPAGAHVNAIGAIALDRMEFEPDLLERCDVVATDSLPQARALSTELREYFDSGKGEWASVREVADLVVEGARRPVGADLTLFKGMGSGIEDLALGIAILERARVARLGSIIASAELPRPRPRLVRTPAVDGHYEAELERKGAPDED